MSCHVISCHVMSPHAIRVALNLLGWDGMGDGMGWGMGWDVTNLLDASSNCLLLLYQFIVSAIAELNCLH
jgi:hypothetical protein